LATNAAEELSNKRKLLMTLQSSKLAGIFQPVQAAIMTLKKLEFLAKQRVLWSRPLWTPIYT
jgi:hypothetical protein